MNGWWIVLASGPSFKRADADMLRPWAAQTVAVNNTVFFAPWAAYHYFADDPWFRVYGWRTKPWYQGRRISRTCKRRGVHEYYKSQGWARTGGNSGHQAIQYAVEKHNAKKVALLGFDHQHTGGKAHFHPDHPKRPLEKINLGNAPGVRGWAQRMILTAKDLRARGVYVVNLSRETALTCFDRMPVEEFCVGGHK